MKISERVTVRDPSSLRFLRSNGVSNAELVPDPATQLTPDVEAGRASLQKANLDPDKPIIGIAARRVLENTVNEKLQISYYEAAKHLRDQGFQVAFIPFCQHKYEPLGMDDQVCRQHVESLDFAQLINYEHPEEVLGIISLLSGLVGTRLHSMIFAHVCDTPFVVIEYADKVTSLLHHYGHSERGIQLDQIGPHRLIECVDDQLL